MMLANASDFSLVARTGMTGIYSTSLVGADLDDAGYLESGIEKLAQK